MALQITELCDQVQQHQWLESTYSPGLSLQALRVQNHRYAGTGGISQLNRDYGFTPAFHDTQDGSTEISRFGDGRPAPFHLLDGLPEQWVAERSPCGKVLTANPSVIAGFVRQQQFYTREQAAGAVKLINLD